MEKSKLPVFKFVLDEDSETSGVNVLSLVEQPAIELNAMKFSKEEKFQFKVTDKARQIFMAPIMRPDFLIFRDEPTYYYGYFDQETIFNIVQKYFKTSKLGNVDINHSGELIKGAYLFESFIIDSTRGNLTPSTYGQTLPDGTWFGSFQVTDPTLWQAIENGDINGVSIEGFFNILPVQMSQKTNLEKVYDEINEIINSIM